MHGKVKAGTEFIHHLNGFETLFGLLGQGETNGIVGGRIAGMKRNEHINFIQLRIHNSSFLKFQLSKVCFSSNIIANLH